MNRETTTIEQTDRHPHEIVRELLARRPVGGELTTAQDTARERGVATLERGVPEMIRSARGGGVDLEYLGIHPLFQDPRFYEGTKTDWIFGPAERDGDVVVPRREAQELRKLVATGVEFPLIYIAHEVEQSDTGGLREAAQEGRHELSPAQADHLIGPVPPPAGTVEVGERLADRTTRAVNRALKVGGAVAAGAVAAPLIAAGAVLGNLDPVIIGAIPALSERAGAPAAWYVLARWDW